MADQGSLVGYPVGDDPDGIVCYNDVAAGNLMRALIESGVKIPGDIQIVGIDDVKFAGMFTVRLTTYRQPCPDIGKAAVRTLLSRIRDKALAPMHTLLKGVLVPRGSSLPKQDA